MSARIGVGEGGGVRVVDLGDHQDVDGCLRVDVPEGDGRVGLTDDGRRDLPADNLAEQTVVLRLACHARPPHAG
jgi:hypothetical protein